MLLLAAAASTPSPAAAQWMQFLPHAYENGAFINAYSSFERDNMTGGEPADRWTDTFFREKLTLFSNGYSYHPRFLQYRFSLSGALKQENYEASGGGSTGWQEGTGLDYDFNLFFLPEHVYNLEAYARRFEPLFKEQAATQHSNVETQEGADFRYREKPYFMHAGYLNDSLETNGQSSDVNRINIDGQYFNRFSTGNEIGFNGVYAPEWFSNTQALNGNSAEYVLTNYLNLYDVPAWAVPLRVTSSVSDDQYQQASPDQGTVKNDQFVWYEWATAKLPLNLRNDVYYRFQDNHGTLGGQEQSNIDRDLKVDLVHRLYESLDTIYTFRNDSRSAPGGDSNFTSQAGTMTYAKEIPRGRVIASAAGSTAKTDTQGIVNALNEPFSSVVPMPQPYVLGQANVVVASIQVFVKDPTSPFGQLILLNQGQNYTVVPVQNTVGVQVTSVPFIGPGPYDFLVSYSTSGDYKLRTNTYGGNASVELLESLVTPYVGYLVVRTDVLSGVFPGVPLDSTTYTGGVILRYRGFQLRGEYQDQQSNVAPYQLWRADAQYVNALNETTSVFASGGYTHQYYPHGTSVSSTAALTEETETASGSIQKQLFARDLFFSAGGVYSHSTGQIDTDAYAINSSLLWRIGKVDITAGVNIYMSNATGDVTQPTKRDHQFFFVNLQRQIF